MRDGEEEAFGSVRDFAVVILLCLFPIVFWFGCGACGQGALAIFVLVPIWIASALFTIASAAVAHFKFVR